MPAMTRLALLTCPLGAATAPASADAAITTVTRDYGPYTIPAGNGDPHDHAAMGHLNNVVNFNVSKPCTNCTINSMTPEIHSTNGTKATSDGGTMT